MGRYAPQPPGDPQCGGPERNPDEQALQPWVDSRRGGDRDQTRREEPAAASVIGLVASSGSGNIRQKISVAARVTEALERPSRMWPVTGIETSAPAAMHSKHNPSVAFEIPRWSCSHGMCATQVPIIAPLIAKTVNVARRGLIRPPR
jgi:hypothetical protein